VACSRAVHKSIERNIQDTDMTRRVAITGYSFRLPGTTTSRYWQDLLDGRDLVTEVDPQRWAQDTFLHPNRNHPGTSYTFAAGSIGDVSTFDAASSVFRRAKRP
jgi:phthiocerol/phenolphthiocerol synthesis type-I polyketide synthase C